ncbi:polysaccharide biosynthesis tyrosine autokinase [Chitinispirillales bacterium ANBcel5]|uniref:GumC family protein n=1 Tax=Cellulosispirillum alkaliphilum TaxID=3039283 RepID=UPI002A57CC01|nr:polysaccharide biosynthesis tyrosine autokinase [Chitinispirillales bacterium ANBcel5]
MEFIDYWNVIVRRKWVIAASFFVIVAAAATYVLLADPVYESQCKILLVEDRAGGGGFGDMGLENIMMQSIGRSDPILTQIEIIKTRPIIEEVIRRCDVRDEEGKLAAYSSFLGKFSFEHIRQTNIVKISARDTDPQRAALYANTLAEVFSEQSQHLNQENVRSAKEFIESQLIVQKEKVEEAENALMEFKTGSHTVALDQETSIRVSAMAELEAERIRLESELRGLEAQREEVEKRLSAVGSQAAPHYTSFANTREQININETSLTARLRAINAQLNRQHQSMKDLPPLEIQLARLIRNERIMNEIYTNLLSQFEEYKIREAAQVASIKLIEPAVPGENPVLPQKKRGVAAAALAGLFFGIGLSFFYEYVKDKPYNIGEIKKILQTNSLGAVPYIGKKVNIFMKDEPHSLSAEALRLVYTNLKFKNVLTEENSSIMISSAQPGEGKTTLTANLAYFIADMGKKTALVSLDLRRPALDKIFSTRFKKGISDYLIGEADLDEIAWTPEYASNLTIFPSVRVPPNPAELIASPKMLYFIEELKETYDVVLFDTPPITMVAETLYLAQGMKGVVLVADYAGTSRRGLRHMQEMLSDKNLPVLGVIINKVNKNAGFKYGYYSYSKKA